jgi:hypothetical protein
MRLCERRSVRLCALYFVALLLNRCHKNVRMYNVPFGVALTLLTVCERQKFEFSIKSLVLGEGNVHSKCGRSCVFCTWFMIVTVPLVNTRNLVDSAVVYLSCNERYARALYIKNCDRIKLVHEGWGKWGVTIRLSADTWSVRLQLLYVIYTGKKWSRSSKEWYYATFPPHNEMPHTAPHTSISGAVGMRCKTLKTYSTFAHAVQHATHCAAAKTKKYYHSSPDPTLRSLS